MNINIRGWNKKIKDWVFENSVKGGWAKENKKACNKNTKGKGLKMCLSPENPLTISCRQKLMRMLKLSSKIPRGVLLHNWGSGVNLFVLV